MELNANVYTMCTNMAIFFLIMVAGYVAKKVGWLNKEMDKGFSKFVLNIALPAMLLASALDAESVPSMEQIGTVMLACVGMYALIVVIAYVFTFIMRVHHGNQGVFRFMMIFSNIGFIGIPIAQVLYGSEGVVYAGIFQLPFGLLVYSLGIYLLIQDRQYLKQDKENAQSEKNASLVNARSVAHSAANDANLAINSTINSNANSTANSTEMSRKPKSQKDTPFWKMLITPALISSIATLVLVLAGVHSVPVLGPACTTLGNATSPVALIIVGSSLANLPVRDLLGGPRLWMCSAVRLIICPLLVWLVFRPIIADPVVLGVMVALSGISVAANGTMFTYEYGGNTKTMAQGTFITAVFSTITIPLIIMITGV